MRTANAASMGIVMLLALLAGCGTNGTDEDQPQASSRVTSVFAGLGISAPAAVPAGETFTISADKGVSLRKYTVWAQGKEEAWILEGVPDGDAGTPSVWPVTEDSSITMELAGPTDKVTFQWDASTTPDTYTVCIAVSPDDTDDPTYRPCINIEVTGPEQTP